MITSNGVEINSKWSYFNSNPVKSKNEFDQTGKSKQPEQDK